MKDTIMWAVVDSKTNEIAIVNNYPLVYVTREDARMAKSAAEKVVKIMIRKY
jgi:hypothetical protein